MTFSAEGAEADYSARDVEFDATGANFTVTEPPTGRFVAPGRQIVPSAVR